MFFLFMGLPMPTNLKMSSKNPWTMLAFPVREAELPRAACVPKPSVLERGQMGGPEKPGAQ
jgi:hypothetical protein